MTGQGTNAGDQDGSRQKILELRQRYAWDWFEYHAGQRVTMFNFFLIISGIFANAYVGLAKEGLVVIASTLGWFGVIAAFLFICLDERNRHMLTWGEDVLMELEKEELFPETRCGRAKWGLLYYEKTNWYFGPQRRWRNFVRHKIMIRVVHVLVLLLFLGGAVVPICCPGLLETRAGKTNSQLEESLRSVIERLDNLERTIGGLTKPN